MKSAVDTAVATIKKADYSDALTQLQAILDKYRPTLTVEQIGAFADMIPTIQQKLLDGQARSVGLAHANKAGTNSTQEPPK